MKRKIQLLPSGISLVDSAWGGFYRGGTYLLIGPRKSGKTLLSLQYAMECAKQKEVCLYFTLMRPKDLMIHASSIDFDLQYYINKNLIIVIKVSPPGNLNESENPDEYLSEYLKDIVTVVEKYQPAKIVFDELTSFVGFKNINSLREIFLKTTESIEDAGITSLFLLGDPASAATKMIVETLAEHATGNIYLEKNDDEGSKTQGGKIIITPNIGHTEGQFASNYSIESYKGIVVDFQSSREIESLKEQKAKQESKYKSFAEITASQDTFITSNIYSRNDFVLILNNQIAKFKATGKTFIIVSFKLESIAKELGLLTIEQLQNAIRFSIDKSDKVCIMDNKVMVLLINSSFGGQVINELILKIKSNLPSNDPDYLKKVIQYISVYAVKVNERHQDGEELIEELIGEDKKEKNNLLFS